MLPHLVQSKGRQAQLHITLVGEEILIGDKEGPSLLHHHNLLKIEPTTPEVTNHESSQASNSTFCDECSPERVVDRL